MNLNTFLFDLIKLKSIKRNELKSLSATATLIKRVKKSPKIKRKQEK